MNESKQIRKESKLDQKFESFGRFIETRKMFLIMLGFIQVWVSVLSFITTQFVYINSLDCSATALIGRLIPVSFFLVQGINAGFIIYLYEKKEISKKLAFFIPMTTLIVSGVVFAILYVNNNPLCNP